MEESAAQETRVVLRAVGGSGGTGWMVRGGVGTWLDVGVASTASILHAVLGPNRHKIVAEGVLK